MRETRTVYVEKIGENKYKAKYVILPGDAKRYTPKEAHEKTYINCYGIPQEYRRINKRTCSSGMCSWNYTYATIKKR